MYLFNYSLAAGIFSSVLKTAKVIPLFKKGDPSLPENYRPVVLLSTNSKILEKIVYNRIVNLASKNNIFTNSQHGFRKGKSTETAIMNFLNLLYENMNENKKCTGLFMDLSKAFDLINHDLLLEKLLFYGLRGKIYDWVKSYLADRNQLVEVNGIRSESQHISIGVPQGSVLGPLLFLFFVNDLPNFVSLSNNLIMFADDNSYLNCDANFSDNISKMQQEILNVRIGLDQIDYF